MFKKKLFNKLLFLLIFIGLLFIFSNKVNAVDLDPSMIKDSSADQAANKIPASEIKIVDGRPMVDTDLGTGWYEKTTAGDKITTTFHLISGSEATKYDHTVNDPTKFPSQYTAIGTETTTSPLVLAANNLPTDTKGLKALVITYKDNETGELISKVSLVSSSLPSDGNISRPTGFLQDCTTTARYANACTACDTGGDDKCGTFESTKTCTLDRIKILFFLSRLCKPKITVEACTITNKECADTTKVCVKNQCIDPNPTPTLTPTTAPTATPTDGPTPSITLTPTPTPPVICPDGETNPHFICRSNGCAQINSCGVNAGGCTQSGGICGLEDGHTYLSLIIGLDGIGSTGDNQNPQDINCTPEQRENQQCGSNWKPLKTNRDVVLELFTDSETSVSTYSSEINFTTGATNSGKFTGAIDLGTTFTGGNYVIKAKSSGYLKREFPYIQAITAAITDGPYVVNTLPGIRLVTANVNQDTSLDIRDYNLLMSCSIFSTDNNGACNQNDNYKVWSDLEDNGEIDQLDYNLLMREWVNQHEQ